jgi:hypothetical protein
MRRLEDTAHKGDIRSANKIIVGSPEEKRLLGVPRKPTSFSLIQTRTRSCGLFL